MRIAIITPYYRETVETLQRCTDSVAEQTHPVQHIMVGDGALAALPAAIQHITLPLPHGDYGDTPRLIGTLSAYSQGFDGVMWLDGDCWLDHRHVSLMVERAQQEVASIVTATRMLMRPDGSLLGQCVESDGEYFTDTNCYLVMRDAIPAVAPKWGFKPKRDAVVGDRFVWEAARHFPRSHLTEPTVFYETLIASHYLERGEEPPDGARVISQNPLTGHFASWLFRN